MSFQAAFQSLEDQTQKKESHNDQIKKKKKKQLEEVGGDGLLTDTSPTCMVR